MSKEPKMTRLEFYVQKIVDYTSRYNYSNSCYYAPNNLIGEYEKYPIYGDFPEAYCLRTYGDWWIKSEGYQKNYRPQDYDPLYADDYVTVQFEAPVIPKDICIYEIFNPGAVVRIWGKVMYKSKRPWILLWEGKPEAYFQESRKFRPVIQQKKYLIKTLRLEFSQRHLNYHYSVEAVLLSGLQPSSALEMNILCQLEQSTLLPQAPKPRPVEEVEGEDFFQHLPNEVILKIFGYLDLRSLSKCAVVSKRWNEITSEPSFYQNLNLKLHWNFINCDTLEYFMNKCKTIKKLDLSWCGSDIENFGNSVIRMVQDNEKTLTHLSLGNSKFVDAHLLMEISLCHELVDLRLKNLMDCFHMRFCGLETLNKLIALDLTAAPVTDVDLVRILKANRNLEHIIIDLCESIQRLDMVVETASFFNKNLITWSSWKTSSLTAEGVRHFGNCKNLRELDLGWCLIGRDPGTCLMNVAQGCPNLTRLILSEWRGLTDALVAPIFLMCKNLTQLDFLGIKNITRETCESALLFLPKLELLDINYCDAISSMEVRNWRKMYPRVTIQKNN